jgi:hypothetical protein
MPNLRQLATGSQQVLPIAMIRYADGRNVVESVRITRYIGTKMAVVNSTVRASGMENESGLASRAYSTQIALYGVDPSKPDFNAKSACRCSCPAYRFWFDHANRAAGASYGARFAPYVRKTPIDDPRYPPKNKENIPGLCKHLLLLTHTITQSGFFSSGVERRPDSAFGTRRVTHTTVDI